MEHGAIFADLFANRIGLDKIILVGLILQTCGMAVRIGGSYFFLLRGMVVSAKRIDERKKMDVHTYRINDNLYDFCEFQKTPYEPKAQPYVDSYLYIGKSRAAVIDTLQTAEGLYDKVRKITDLPIDVLITHGHLDHCGVAVREFADAGCRIFMSLADFSILTSMVSYVKKEWFIDLHDGDQFDLGDRVLETIGCGGHSPGSVIFLDRKNQIMFSGDSIGSAHFWMQLPSCLSLHMFEKNLSSLSNKVVMLDHLLIYPGHRFQAPVQLTGAYIDDTLTLTRKLLSGEIIGKDTSLEIDGININYKSAAYGDMLDYCYSPSNM